MPDVYAAITEADPATIERLAEAMELRAAHCIYQRDRSKTVVDETTGGRTCTRWIDRPF